MTRTPEKNFLRAWREYRSLTQAKLAEAVGTTGAVISLLESGDRGLSDKWLRRLAPVLGTSPGHLLEVHPNDVPSDIMEIWALVPEENRKQARDILKTFSRPVEEPNDGGKLVDLKDFRPKTPKKPSDQPKKTNTGGDQETP